MIDKADKDYIARLIAYTNESLKLFSNPNKPERERRACAAFLRCLGVRFLPSDLHSAEKEPPDVRFQDANFEVRELLPHGRKRGDEYKERHEILKQARNIEDTLLPLEWPSSISYDELFDKITEALSKKVERYRKRGGCSSLDALVHVSLGRFLDPSTPIAPHDALIAQGWRSVSFVFPPYSRVVFARDTAPQFLRLNEGQTRNAWADPDTFFELTSQSHK